ncbi:hypothetical protein NST21_12335 [Peribacillus sp. FSL K6-1552]|uniref:hypothetical protein n=1 Tax=Peribacillus sp. FSL K6-1552 TaxID=2954514 RepID=UPI0030FBEDE8
MKKQITEEVKKNFVEMATAKVEELKSQYEQLLNGLPKPPSIEERKNQSFQAMVIQRKIESSRKRRRTWHGPTCLRINALRGWVFLENTSKKDQFVRTYINERFVERDG